MIDKLITVHPIRTEQDMRDVMLAQQTIGHSCILPTHMVMREGEVVGAFSLGAVPLVTAWQDPKRVGARDSAMLISMVDSLLSGTGRPIWAIPCQKDSPYYAFMERFGFVKAGDATLFIKKV